MFSKTLTNWLISTLIKLLKRDHFWRKSKNLIIPVSKSKQNFTYIIIFKIADQNNYSHGNGSLQGRPIIVVPGSTEYPGNICLKNAVQFLRDGIYIEPNNVKFATDHEKYENKKTFIKKLGDQEVTFEVYDSTQQFSEKHWQRVVCLFTSGEVF
jgi:hypothetical protein